MTSKTDREDRPDYVLVPRERLKALLNELRAIREEQSEQQKRIARATGELVEWVNFPTADRLPPSPTQGAQNDMSTEQIERSLEAIYEALYEIKRLSLEVVDKRDARVMALDEAVTKLSSIIYSEPTRPTP